MHGQTTEPKPYRHLGLKIDAQVCEKLRYIARGEGRSLSGHILCLLRRQVQAYERKYGPIDEAQLQQARIASRPASRNDEKRRQG